MTTDRSSHASTDRSGRCDCVRPATNKSDDACESDATYHGARNESRVRRTVTDRVAARILPVEVKGDTSFVDVTMKALWSVIRGNSPVTKLPNG